MRRPGVDLTIPARGGQRIRVVSRPGAWMGDAGLAALVADLRSVADASTPGGPLRYGVLSGSRRRLARAILCVAYDGRTGAAIGFSAPTLIRERIEGRRSPILHVGLCMIRPEHRNRGLCFALNAGAPLLAFALNGFRPLWMTNVTQVPAAAGVFAALVPQAYPAPAGACARSPGHDAVAAVLMARHRSVFGVGEDADWDPARFVIRNAYTGGSDDLKKPFAACAQHRDPAVNRFCADRLDYARGDDLLQVGRLALTQATATLGRFALDVVGSPARLMLALLPALRPAPLGVPRRAALGAGGRR